MHNFSKRLSKYMDFKGIVNANNLGKVLGYTSSEKIARLFRDENNKPSYDILTDIANKFVDLNVNWLITGEGSMIKNTEGDQMASDPVVQYGNPTILPIVVDKHDQERIPLVQSKAAAGYIGQYMEPEYISKLPNFSIPGMLNATFRMFEITGHSMMPTLYDGDIVIARYVEKITDIRNDRIHVLVTNNDLLVKRTILRMDEEKIVAKSDNIDQGYPTINIDISDIREVWYVKKNLTGQFPNPTGIFQRIANLEADLSIVNEKLKKVQ